MPRLQTVSALRLLNEYEGRVTSTSLAHQLVSSRCLHAGDNCGPAFVFDIDGVLVRGKEVLEPAKRALARLYNEDGNEPAYPVCFLTNGGGVVEGAKAEQLTKWLGVRVKPEQVVLSHTPFRELAERLSDNPVLVAGRHDVAAVARDYGFCETVTTAQLAAAHPNAVPFASGSFAAGPMTSHGTEESPIKAILVFTDPSDWYVDLQIMAELMTSGGVIGGPPARSSAPSVEIIFSNPDKYFANEHPSPRFGQGAFAIALKALLKEAADYDPPSWTVLGKPNAEPFRMAAQLLTEQAERMHPDRPADRHGFDAIYMVGDNPDADILGARNAGPPWQSILVRTGVFSSPEANCSRIPADIVVENVADAVEAALHRSRSQKWHSLR